MAHQNNFRAMLEQIRDSGQRRTDTRVVGDRTVFHRHVEVDSNKHALTVYIRRLNGFDIGHNASLERMRRPEAGAPR